MMKKALSVFLLILLVVSSYGQNMLVKKPDFNFHPHPQKRVTSILDTLSSNKAKQHPEYGILPFNAQCSECVELIDKRTINTRFFVDPYVPTHTFSQTSYFPLHYKLSPDDIWRTIDPRLAADQNTPGLYTATNQPVPAKCDLNKKTVSLTDRGVEFEFNKNLTLYFIDDSVAVSKAQPGNYTNYKIGEQGLQVTNMWPDIDMQQVFGVGEIKTTYTINKPLQVPVSKGYMVIEDHFILPEGCTFEEEENGSHLQNHQFKGNYQLKDKNGHLLIRYQKPVYMDANSYGMQGIYKLENNGKNYSIKTLIPVSWLNRGENAYPLTIDPQITGDTVYVVPGDSAIGNFIHSTLPQANLGFTTVSLGSCDYHMSVTVPGQSQLLNTTIDLEYQLTFSNLCGNPPEPYPYCLFSQVRQDVSCDRCPQDHVTFSCANIGDTTGFCTTDNSVLLSNGARPHAPTFSYGAFLYCYPPQCPDYDIPFTLKNTDSICGDQCGFLCARGTKWGMTIEACTVSGYISQNKTKVCAGQSAIFTAHPVCGVPPYHFIWSSDGGNTFDTIYGDPNLVVNTSNTLTHPDSIYVVCYIGDTCWNPNPYPANSLQLNIIPSPRANAGPDKNLCLGGTVTIGGNPTTDNNATTTWTGSTPTVQSWLSSTTAANPTVNVPFGTVDTFYYILITNNQTCPNTDTAFIYSVAGEKVTIDSLSATRVCAGVTVKLTTLGGPFASYIWNNGIADSLMSTTAPGPYFVIVKDSSGCLDTSNVITVSNFGPPTVNIYPDTTILSGDSVMLYSDINLFSTSVDSFFWYPNISCINCTNPVVAPLTDAIYNLTIYSHGCLVSAKVLIQVIQPDNFYIPNAFTPNGDGNNDKFYIQSQYGVTVLQFQVFDRWGEKVHDGMYPWDGTYKGKPSQPGVYVYIFKLQLYGRQQAIMRKGSVTLLK